MVTPVPDVDVNYLSDQGCLVVIVVAKSHNHRFPDTNDKQSRNNLAFSKRCPTRRGPRVFRLASCSSVEILLHLYKVQPERLYITTELYIIFQNLSIHVVHNETHCNPFQSDVLLGRSVRDKIFLVEEPELVRFA